MFDVQPSLDSTTESTARTDTVTEVHNRRDPEITHLHTPTQVSLQSKAKKASEKGRALNAPKEGEEKIPKQN